jgi:predicted N-acetyltransferase YhbS
MSLVVRLVKEADLAAADRVLCEAFARPASFLPHMRLHLRMEPRLFYVAEDARQIVGTVGAVDYGPIAYVGLMAVDPALQRRGIARRLIEPLLDELDTRGCTQILLDATDQGAPLYENLGFVGDGQARVFELRTMTAGEVPASSVEISASADLAELVAFDAESFGASRAKLLAALWELYRERVLVARDDVGKLQGYLFARDPTLGPWVVRSPAAAELLLTEALRLPYRQTPHVMIPRSNQAAAELLGTHGFVEQRKLRHMRRGGHGSCGQPENLYGQASFAHG